MAYLNNEPTAPTDGAKHSNAVVLTATEATLGNTGTPDPVPVAEGQEIVAVVVLTVTGYITGNSTFVFLQTDLFSDGNWVDVAWCFWDGRQGSATFFLSAGGRGAMDNAAQKTRQASSAPATQASGSNKLPLGGRVRFTGFTKMIGGSSSVSGTPTAVSATITYKLTAPR